MTCSHLTIDLRPTVKNLGSKLHHTMSNEKQLEPPGALGTDPSSRPVLGSNKKESRFGETDFNVETVSVDEDAAIDGVEPVYAAKAKVLNRAIQDIGMGR